MPPPIYTQSLRMLKTSLICVYTVAAVRMEPNLVSVHSCGSLWEGTGVCVCVWQVAVQSLGLGLFIYN